MGLGLAAPLGLGLLALVALPLLAHLARREPSNRRAFGAMLLLERVMKRLQRRRRLQEIPLLLLRLLIVVLLVLAAAGLTFTHRLDAPEFGGTGRVIVLLDRSMSMSQMQGERSLFEIASKDAVDLLAALPSTSTAELIVFDEVVQTHQGTVSQLTQEIERAKPQASGSNLRAALARARELLQGEPGEVVVFTDQAGPTMVPDAKEEMELLLLRGSSVIPKVVGSRTPGNITVLQAVYSAGVEGGQLSITVANYANVAIETSCEATLPDETTVTVFLELPAQGQATKIMTLPRKVAGGVGRVTCRDEVLVADNTRTFHLPQIGPSRVLIVDGDPGDSPIRSEVYFVERALAPWGGLRTGVRPEVISPAGLQGLDPQEHRVVLLANVGDPRPFSLQLTAFVRKGGHLLITGGSNVTPLRTNLAFRTILPSPLMASQAFGGGVREGLALLSPSLDSVLFRSFEGARAGFSRVQAKRALLFEPYEESAEVQTLLSFEGGLPALVRRRVGLGSVLVWTSTFDLGWGNLPLQAVFMPMIQQIISQLGGESALGVERFDGVVGRSMSITAPEGVSEVEIVDASGVRQDATRQGAVVRFTPRSPGAYALTVVGAPPLAWIAVNTAIEESDVRVSHTLAAMEAEVAPELFLKTSDLSLGLLVLSLLGLLGQAFAARRRRV